MYSDRKIDLMIVGAQKSGTTSLKNYLGQHPEVVTHLETEFSYFLHEIEFDKGPAGMFRKNFPSALQGSSKKIIAKSAGMYVDEEALQRLKNLNPDCKLVLLLRNPVERAYSSYLMEVSRVGFAKPWKSIETSLENFFYRGEKDQMFRLFIELGLYADQLKKIYRCFSKEQVLIFRCEKFSLDSLSVCRTIFKELEVDDSFVPDVSHRYNSANLPRIKAMTQILSWLRFNHNPVKRTLKFILPPATFINLSHWITRVMSIPHKPELMDPQLQTTLNDFFNPYTKELQLMTGENFDSWINGSKKVSYEQFGEAQGLGFTQVK